MWQYFILLCQAQLINALCQASFGACQNTSKCRSRHLEYFYQESSALRKRISIQDVFCCSASGAEQQKTSNTLVEHRHSQSNIQLDIGNAIQKQSACHRMGLQKAIGSKALQFIPHIIEKIFSIAAFLAPKQKHIMLHTLFLVFLLSHASSHTDSFRKRNARH